MNLYNPKKYAEDLLKQHEDFLNSESAGTVDFDTWKAKYKKLDFYNSTDLIDEAFEDVDAILNTIPQISEFNYYMTGPTALFRGKRYISNTVEGNPETILNRLLERTDSALYNIKSVVRYNEEYFEMNRTYIIRYGLISGEPLDFK